MSRSRKRGIQQPPPDPKRYEIVLTRAAERGLASLPKTELRRVDAKIQGLAGIPRPPGVKKLEGVAEEIFTGRWVTFPLAPLARGKRCSKSSQHISERPRPYKRPPLRSPSSRLRSFRGSICMHDTLRNAPFSGVSRNPGEPSFSTQVNDG